MIGGREYEYKDFLNIHKPQLVHAGVPEHYYRTIFEKIENETYDSGSYFMMMTDGENWEVQSTKTIDSTDANTIFLIDHCWTFHPGQAKKSLKSIPGLAPRIAGIVGIGFPDFDEEDEEEPNEALEEKMAEAFDDLIDSLSEDIWQLAETYTIQKDNESISVCYIMDEFGSRVHHSETPNVKLAPFFHIQKQYAVTLMWPVWDEIPAEEVITRDITFGETTKNKRAARLIVAPGDHEVNKDDLRMSEFDKISNFKMYGRKEQTLPDNVPDDENHPATLKIKTISSSKPFKIYTDLDFMANVITDPMFKIVNTQEDADWIFTSVHFDQFKQLYEDHPSKLINQFPSENIICCKDLLLKVGRRSTLNPDLIEHCDDIIRTKLNVDDPNWAEDLHPSWLPIGFDLVNELPVFVRLFLEREEKGLDNTWIIKPWNLSRGMFTYVTSNLAMIVKLSYTSPKIIQKYIERPVLFYRGEIGKVKFDIRYVILLKSVKPLKLYKYNVFWLRFANKPFGLTEFDLYEKHFTVMNYVEDQDLKQIHCDDFIPMFEQQYPNFKWEDIDQNNCRMIRECFESATSLPPNRGLGHSAQSRAIYAVDFMLKWNEDNTEMISQMLEINFNPDNQRACQYHPEFYNHCLKTLLFDNHENIPVTDISS